MRHRHSSPQAARRRRSNALSSSLGCSGCLYPMKPDSLAGTVVSGSTMVDEGLWERQPYLGLVGLQPCSSSTEHVCTENSVLSVSHNDAGGCTLPNNVLRRPSPFNECRHPSETSPYCRFRSEPSGVIHGTHFRETSQVLHPQLLGEVLATLRSASHCTNMADDQKPSMHDSEPQTVVT